MFGHFTTCMKGLIFSSSKEMKSKDDAKRISSLFFSKVMKGIAKECTVKRNNLLEDYFYTNSCKC